MKVHQKLRLYVLPLIILAGFATNALASCPGFGQGPPCVEYWRTDAVFVGVADRVVNIPNNTGLMFGPYARSTVYFTIEEAFKGVGGTALVMELDQCGYAFKEGQRYLVYANRNPNNKELEVRVLNTRTRPLSEAAGDLQYIRGLSTAEPFSRVFGKVIQSTHNVKERRQDVDGLPNVKVMLEGKERYEVLTDNEGRFEFNRVLPGEYRLRAELPRYVSYDEQTVKLNGRDCLPVDIWASRKAQIAGSVVDENDTPLPNVPVYLVSADASREDILADGKGKVLWPLTYTDRQGRFRFTQLAPGRYLVAINLTQSETRRGKGTSRALPRLFYPGVNDVIGATVIVVGDFPDQREYQFRLPAP